MTESAAAAAETTPTVASVPDRPAAQENGVRATSTTSTASSSTSDNITSLGGTAYMFYLNVVVLNHNLAVTSSKDSTDDGDNDSGHHDEDNRAEEEAGNEAASGNDNNDDDDEEEDRSTGEIVAKTPSKEQKGHFQSVMIQNLMSPSIQNTMKALSKSRAATDNALKNSMKAMRLSSIEATKKATTFVASKTMVSRASHALNKSLPILLQSTGASDHLKGVQLNRKFQQGSVFVIQVDLRPTELPDYVAEVFGAEASRQYRATATHLGGLQMHETRACLEREMLPRVRRGLMDRLSDALVAEMKAQESMLEVQCIPLEETDEARWLFTFMEFRDQMK